MVSPGLQWSLLVSSGLQWSLLVSSGLCWSPLVSSGLTWSPGVSLGLQGSLLVSLVSSGLCWSPVVSSGLPLSLVLVSAGLQWSLQSPVVSAGLQWSLLVFSGLCWSLLVSLGLQGGPVGFQLLLVININDSLYQETAIWRDSGWEVILLNICLREEDGQHYWEQHLLLSQEWKLNFELANSHIYHLNSTQLNFETPTVVVIPPQVSVYHQNWTLNFFCSNSHDLCQILHCLFCLSASLIPKVQFWW